MKHLLFGLSIGVVFCVLAIMFSGLYWGLGWVLEHIIKSSLARLGLFLGICFFGATALATALHYVEEKEKNKRAYGG